MMSLTRVRQWLAKANPARDDSPLHNHDDARLFSLPKVSRVELGPSDVLVLTCTSLLPDSVHARLMEQMKTAWPHHTILVLDSTLTLTVITREQAEHVAARLRDAS